ncbi:MAG: ABC transporter permease [Acidobacteria bacterium]|nr:ABC transporter permease [Acidobacteriota bacterium]
MNTTADLKLKPGLTSSAESRVYVRLAPSTGWASLKLDDLWEYRELLLLMAWRDVQVRYKQTAFGAAWAIIQPLLTMLVFSLFFGRLAKMPSDGIPYPLFSYAALVPWTLFANTVNQATLSVQGNAPLIKKVYFPRLIIPIATMLTGLVDFLVAFGVLLAMMLFYGIVPSWNVLWLPAFLLLALATTLGVGLWLGALNAQFLDMRFVVPFLIQFWLFATPIAYPSSLLQEPWRTVYGINPMVGVVEGFRWALLNTDTAPGPIVAASAVVATLLLVSGAFYYRRMERSFADVF